MTGDWTSSPISANQNLRQNLRTMRARSRERAVNDPYVHKLLAMAKSNIIGDRGIVLQATVKNSKGELDRPANQAIEGAWQEWGQTKACDVTGQLTWVQMQHLAVETRWKDGEYFLRRHLGARFAPWGIAYQFLDAELLDVEKNETLPNGNIVRMGVELNSLKRPVAYWFTDVEEQPDGTIYSIRKSYVRVPADEIVHGFLIESPNQARGCPLMYSALHRLKMLGAADEAALVATRIGASFMGGISSPTGEEFKGEGEDEDGAVVFEIEPGVFRQFAEGTTFHNFDPKYPDAQYPEFQKAMLRGASAGVLAAYPTLSQDFGSITFSSIRASLIDERDTWKMFQSEEIADLCDPVQRDWFSVQLLNGNLNVGQGALDTERESAYRSHKWRGRRYEWVDPQKEALAAKTAIESRVRSRFSVIRDITQDDPEDVVREIALEEKLFADLGISIVQADAPATEPPKEKDPEELEDD